MKTLLLSAVASMSFAGASLAATPSPGIATVTQFLGAFNKGDIAGAAATQAPDVTIIDEVPPHIWKGAGAFQAWLGDLSADDKAHERTGQHVELGATLRDMTSGDRAYAVVAVVYTYKEKGVATREPAEMTFALQNGAGGWKISGWAWDGTVPKPAK